eukprot:6177897-Pleurochrysis_carterae.AAC.7
MISSNEPGNLVLVIHDIMRYKYLCIFHNLSSISVVFRRLSSACNHPGSTTAMRLVRNLRSLGILRRPSRAPSPPVPLQYPVKPARARLDDAGSAAVWIAGRVDSGARRGRRGGARSRGAASA